MIRKRFQAVLVVMTMAVVAVLSLQTPVFASWSTCPALAKVCVFDYGGGSGDYYAIYGDYTNYCFNLSTFNDRAGSVYNKSGKTIDLFEHAGCQSGNGWRYGNLLNGWAVSFSLDMSNELTGIYFRS